ncbi:MAG TPA: type I glyceraldehyde-3-phosphate dehydrogenase [Bacillota bacterium]|jgi:glyceraldehyde 3-phosphate dehydrogenase|nr:type I glyceraldehyde-3-phosphate dehydrogenase [Bacillota bacterium]
MKTKVGINGFGRIGRNAFKVAAENDDLFEIIAINDVTDSKTLAHLLKYDSCFTKFEAEVEAREDAIIVNGREIKILAVRNPEELPWKELGADIILESTGLFTKKADAEKHIKAGAKKVIISAPATDEDITVVMGVNDDKYDPAIHQVISNASCTTNCLAPIAKVIDEEFGIERGLMTTIHSYTNDQRILDLPHKDLRRARAAAVSMIPTTTGAAKAVALVLPQLKGKLNGMSIRIPTPAVSLVDVVFELKGETDKETVNKALKEAAEGKMKNILGYCDEPLVSIDFKQDPRSSVVDALSTMMSESRMLKVLSWYDNEWGYSNRIIDLLNMIISKGL